MKRTMSMTGINVDLPDDVEPSEQSDSHQGSAINDQRKRNVAAVSGPSGVDRRPMATASPHKRSSGGGGGGEVVVETAPFLRTCGLCNRRLRPGRDIFMYRGDTAFCSLECREQQIKHDEKKEKCSVAANSMKDGSHHQYHSPAPATTTVTATSQA